MNVAAMIADMARKYPKQADRIEAWAAEYATALQRYEGERLAEAYRVCMTGWKGLFFPNPADIAAHIPGAKAATKAALKTGSLQRASEILWAFLDWFAETDLGRQARTEGWWHGGLCDYLRRIANYQAQLLAEAEANDWAGPRRLADPAKREQFQLDALELERRISVAVPDEMMRRWQCWAQAPNAEAIAYRRDDSGSIVGFDVLRTARARPLHLTDFTASGTAAATVADGAPGDIAGETDERTDDRRGDRADLGDQGRAGGGGARSAGVRGVSGRADERQRCDDDVEDGGIRGRMDQEERDHPVAGVGGVADGDDAREPERGGAAGPACGALPEPASSAAGPAGARQRIDPFAVARQRRGAA